MSDDSATNRSVVIVGGGIGGLFSATVLVSLGVSDITLIEKSDQLGGLLKSKTYQKPIDDVRDFTFDYGTHFVLKTGNEAIDEILDQEVGSEDYTEFSGSLPEGQYINGSLFCDSGCANATLFSKDILETVKRELPEDSEEGKLFQNLRELLVHKYGPTATEKIYAPAFKKFTGFDLDDLDASIETVFNASRLIVAGREDSIALKKKHDQNIAYAHYGDGQSDILKYYPAKGSVQNWVDDMASQLKKAGVKIRTSTNIGSMSKDESGVYNFDLGGESIRADFLIWTLPSIFLAKMMGIEVPSMPPKIRHVSVVNIITDKKPVSGPYWVTVYDPDKLSYRLTLYNNFAPENLGGAYRISVEVLHDGDFSGEDVHQKKIFNELIAMGVLPDGASALWSDVVALPGGFPVTKPGDNEVYQEQSAILSEKLSNLYIVKKGHGQIDLMEDIYKSLSAEFVPSQGVKNYA